MIRSPSKKKQSKLWRGKTKVKMVKKTGKQSGQRKEKKLETLTKYSTVPCGCVSERDSGIFFSLLLWLLLFVLGKFNLPLAFDND